jgi:O-antigen/teichoic acid export membrane protein
MVDFKKIRSKIFLLRGLVFIGSADIVGSIISAVFWFFVASLLLVEEYGELTYVITIAALITSTSIVGSSNTIVVFSSKESQSKESQSIQALIFLSLLVALGGSIIAFIIFQKFEIIFLVFSFLIFQVSLDILVGKKLYSKYSKFVLTQKIIQFILGIGLYYVIGIDGILIGIILSNLPLLLVISKQMHNFKLNFSVLKIKKEFITNNYILFLISVFRRDIDKIIIVPILGFTVLGNFALAMQFYAILMVISSASYKYLLPEDVSGSKNKRLKKILILLSIVISITSFILSPIFIEIFLPKYIDSIIAIQIVSFAVIPGTIGLILYSKFLALEKNKFLILTTIIQLCSVLFGTVFLGLYLGIIGIALSYLIATSVYAVTLAIINYHHIGAKKFDI